MMLMYALERRSSGFILAFAGGCLLSSIERSRGAPETPPFPHGKAVVSARSAGAIEIRPHQKPEQRAPTRSHPHEGAIVTRRGWVDGDVSQVVSTSSISVRASA
jgi:hypothetical protein